MLKASVVSLQQLVSLSGNLSGAAENIERVARQLVNNQEKEDVENVLNDGRNVAVIRPIRRLLRVTMAPILARVLNMNISILPKILIFVQNFYFFSKF